MSTLWDLQNFIVERRCLLHILACLNPLLQLLLHDVECLSAEGVLRSWKIKGFLYMSPRASFTDTIHDTLSLPTLHALNATATPKLCQIVTTDLMGAAFVPEGKLSAPKPRTKQLA